jgi:hypothetical protein
LAHTQIEAVVDFGDLQVFEGVTTYPVIITLRRSGAPDAAQNIRFLALKTELPAKLSETFKDHAGLMPQGQLGVDSWRLEDSRAADLRHKLQSGHQTLKEVYGSPLYGLKTGLNEAFVLDGATRDRLVLEDNRSAAVLKPFLRGENLKKWRVEAHNEHLLLIKNGSTRLGFEAQQGKPLAEAAGSEPVEALAWQWFSTQQPAVARWLQAFEPQARKRSDQGEFWWELRACAYYDKFDSAKIFYPDLSQGAKFSFDAAGRYAGNTVYFIANAQAWTAALLNSRLIWFYLSGICDAMRGGEWRLRLFTENMERIPAPEVSQAIQKQLADLAQSAQTAAETRRDEIAKFGRAALRDLVPGGLSNLTLTKGAKAAALPAAWQTELPTFGDLTAELKKRFKRELNLQERNDWDDAVAQARQKVAALTATITQAEREIDTLVYQLFALTPDEIRLVEASAT